MKYGMAIWASNFSTGKEICLLITIMVADFIVLTMDEVLVKSLPSIYHVTDSWRTTRR